MNEEGPEKKNEANLDQLTFNAFLGLLKDKDGLPKLKEVHRKLISDIIKKSAKQKMSSTPTNKKLTKNSSPSAKPKLQHLKSTPVLIKQKDLK